MPTAIIGAGISAAGSVAGGISSGKGAREAAQIQSDSAAKQTAALQQMYQENVARATPTFENGSAAQSRIQTLLGLKGGDGTDPQAALKAIPGYQFAVDQGNQAVNSNAYASGQGNSGAALRALQERAIGTANQYEGQYVGQLGDVANRGVNAMNGLINQGNLTTGAINQQTSNAANANSSNAAFQGQNWANVFKGLANAGGQAFGSSYAPNNAGNAISNFQVPANYNWGSS